MTMTRLICTIVMIVLAIYDGIMVNFYGVDASISRFMQNTAMDSPVFAFGMGFLAGHFFGYMKPTTIRARDVQS